jgi:Family of unknown function (DUF5695)
VSDLLAIRSADLSVEIDAARGVALRLADERLPGPSYLAGTPVPFPSALGTEPLLTGDLVCRVWAGDGWRLETTARSTARCAAGPSGLITVDHPAGQQAPGALRDLAVRQTWAVSGAVLHWTIELRNQAAEPREVGEVAIPLVANTDVAGIFAGQPPRRRAGGELQRRWHETRVQQYLHIGGHASYVLLQRPSGQGRIAALVPLGDTALEAAYQVDPAQGSQWSDVFEGPYFLALHSRAARQVHRWLGNRERQNQWFHGNSSLLLDPGQAYQFGFEVALLGDEAELAGHLVGAGQLAVQAAPGFAVPVGSPVAVALSLGALSLDARAGATQPELIPEADSIAVDDRGPAGERAGAQTWRYTLRFGTVGQKSVLVRYGARWTRLLFYAVPPAAALLRARSEFITSHQLYRNPADPFGRHHAFLPYDDQLQRVYTDSEEAWQVGGSDEYGLPVAMFLAAKNVHDPDPAQVRALETYIDDWLLQRLQDPATFGIRRGRYHTSQLPSARGHEWTEQQSRDERRLNNYPLVANIYRDMARIARRYGLTRSRDAAGYLTLAWRTAVHGFQVGELTLAGAPAGAGLFDLLDDLAAHDASGFAALDAELRRFAAAVAADAYPYGSELYIDQTAHSQVYAAFERYGPAGRLAGCLRVTSMLRWGFQPSWFRYGNEQRGSVCCWYGTPQNSEVLLKGFQLTGDRRLLKLAVAGLSSFLTSVRENGAARGWFTWWPDRTGFDSRSLDTDLGLYAYLRAAAAYVLTEEPFGLVGYGCSVRPVPGDGIAVTPANGVDDRVYFCDHDLAVLASSRLHQVVLSAGASVLTVDAGPVGLPGTVRVQGREVRSAALLTESGPHPAAVADGAVSVPVQPAAGPVTVQIELAGS